MVSRCCMRTLQLNLLYMFFFFNDLHVFFWGSIRPCQFGLPMTSIRIPHRARLDPSHEPKSFRSGGIVGEKCGEKGLHTISWYHMISMLVIDYWILLTEVDIHNLLPPGVRTSLMIQRLEVRYSRSREKMTIVLDGSSHVYHFLIGEEWLRHSHTSQKKLTSWSWVIPKFVWIIGDIC